MDDGGLRRATAVLTLAPALSRGGKLCMDSGNFSKLSQKRLVALCI
jgi:hypothetical protein